MKESSRIYAGESQYGAQISYLLNGLTSIHLPTGGDLNPLRNISRRLYYYRAREGLSGSTVNGLENVETRHTATN